VTDPHDTASELADVVGEFAEIFGEPPTLAEFLEIIGWAIPTASESLADGFAEPMRFTATVGTKPYAGDPPSRVGDLDDHLFEDARSALLDLVRRRHALSGEPVTPERFAAALLDILHTGRITLSDVNGTDVRKLVPEKKRAAKPKVGDVVAIPAREGGNRVGVVVAQNRFGMAIGLFDGTTPRRHPVYTDDGLIKNGTWQITGHDESLLEPFPRDPAIYHQPNAWPGIDTGEHGAAETADGTMRKIDPDEARAVGLADGSYRQVYPAAYLQKVLDDRAGGS